MLTTQRDCRETSAISTPTMMLAIRPPSDSSAVIASDVSSDGNRATTALATAHGDGSMNGCTWKIHKMSCQMSSSAPKTATAFAAAMRRFLISARQRPAQRVRNLRHKIFEFTRLVQLRRARKRQLDRKNRVDAARIRLQHDNARGEKHRFGDRVRDEHGGPSLLRPQAQQFFVQSVARHFIQSRERLVHQ